MSQHRSLKGASTIAARRNVLKRFERVEVLKKRGQWKDGSKVIGLPKTLHKFQRAAERARPRQSRWQTSSRRASAYHHVA